MISKKMYHDFANYWHAKSGAKFILLNRENKLEQYISWVLAAMQKKWTFKEYDQKFGFDAKAFYTYCTQNISFFNRCLYDLETSSARFTTVNYGMNNRYDREDLKRIFDFISGEHWIELYESYQHYNKQMQKELSDYLYNPKVLDVVRKIRYRI